MHAYIILMKQMSTMAMLNLLQLPIELLFRIFDNLDELNILVSIRNVCRRLNAIIDVYYRYQVRRVFSIDCNEGMFRFSTR